jgi:outer membrane protein assembly factor BamB
VDVDRNTGRVDFATLDRGVLFVQTNRAIVHAIDAESGRTLWSTQIGRQNHPSLPPAANEDYIAVVNGSVLFVCDRHTGKLQWQRTLRGVAGSGPVMSGTRVFVAMVDGTVEGYLLNDYEAPRWMYRSEGRILVQPIETARSIAWTTDDGFLYVADAAEPPVVKFRLEAGRAIESRAGHWSPHIFTCSLDGFVYAVNENTGHSDWRFSTGDPIYQPPAPIGDHVFVAPEGVGMYCVNTKTGRPNWFAPGVARFLAASPTRVYGLDRYGRMLILSLSSGALEDLLPTTGVNFTLINNQTDRIYLGTKQGILQCLHEAELTKPVRYQPPVPKPAPTPQPTPVPKPTPRATLEGQSLDDAAPAAEEMPKEEEPAATDENPFG